MDYIYILGIKLHKIKKKDILKKIKEWLAGDKFHYITTVNPEFILEAQKDKEFKDILNNADLSIPDGMGLKFAAWFFGRNIYRVPGADLTKELLKIEGRKYFFIWKEGLSGVEDVKRAVNGRDALQCVSTAAKCEIDGQAIERDGRDIDWKKFNDFSPDILFVGLGAPYQEKLIAKIKAEIGQGSDDYSICQTAEVLDGECFVKQTNGGILRPPGARAQNDALFRREIKVVIGIGGTFDFLTGKTCRAPKIIRM
ncbi:MAG: WecB/TagA/CpsF family glycosyltransferase, partial [bacterium]